MVFCFAWTMFTANCCMVILTRRAISPPRSEEHTSELQSLRHLVCRLLLEKKKKPDSKAGNCPSAADDNKRRLDPPEWGKAPTHARARVQGPVLRQRLPGRGRVGLVHQVGV